MLIFLPYCVGQSITKADASPVTIADFGAQAIVNQFINKEFPADPIVGEEDSKDLMENDGLCEKVLALTNSVSETPMSKQEVWSHCTWKVILD